MERAMVASFLAMQGVAYALAWFWAQKNGGLRKHLGFLLLTAWFALFCLISPCLGTFVYGQGSLYTIDFRECIEEAVLYYLLCYLLFFFVYALLCRFWKPKPGHWGVNLSSVLMGRLLLLCALVLAANLALFSYFHPGQPFLVVLRSLGMSPYLEGLSESLIPLVLLFLFSSAGKKTKASVLVLVTLYFMLTGWRYRLIVLYLALAAGYFLLVHQLLRPKHYLYLAFFVVAGLTVFQLYSLNRWAINKNKIGTNWRWDLRLAGGSFLVEQTRNYQVLASAMARDDLWAHDKGKSMFASMAYRPLPSSWVDKPDNLVVEVVRKLAAQQTHWETDKALGAVTLPGEFYLHFGWNGAPLAALFLAFCCFLVSTARANSDDLFHLLVLVLFSAYSFHLFSRGYLAQHLEMLTYMALPLLAVAWASRTKTK